MLYTVKFVRVSVYGLVLIVCSSCSGGVITSREQTDNDETSAEPRLIDEGDRLTQGGVDYFLTVKSGYPRNYEMLMTTTTHQDDC